METNDDIILYDTEKQSSVGPKIKTFNIVQPDVIAPTEEFDFKNPPVDPTEFASSLVETAKAKNLYGLSATECGFQHRVFVMGHGEEFIACFNPTIVSTEGESHLPEVCATFPMLQLRITRPKKIKVEYQDYKGDLRAATFEGLTARTFQHELDHLNGILYTSRVKPLALKSGIKKIEKIKRKYFDPKIMKKLQNGQKTNP